jgi:hypothetical protein
MMSLVNVADVGAVRIENVTGVMIYAPDKQTKCWELHIDVLGCPEGVMVFEFPDDESATEAMMQLIIDSEEYDMNCCGFLPEEAPKEEDEGC